MPKKYRVIGILAAILFFSLQAAENPNTYAMAKNILNNFYVGAESGRSTGYFDFGGRNILGGFKNDWSETNKSHFDKFFIGYKITDR